MDDIWQSIILLWYVGAQFQRNMIAWAEMEQVGQMRPESEKSPHSTYVNHLE